MAVAGFGIIKGKKTLNQTMMTFRQVLYFAESQ
jgi:hypothetical protein